MTEERKVFTWHDVAAPEIPDDVHVVQPGESLPQIAERHGHPGEWRALYEETVPAEAREYIDPNALTPGLWLRLPSDWVIQPETEAPAEPDSPARPWWMAPTVPPDASVPDRPDAASPDFAPARGFGALPSETADTPQIGPPPPSPTGIRTDQDAGPASTAAPQTGQSPSPTSSRPVSPEQPLG